MWPRPPLPRTSAVMGSGRGAPQKEPSLSGYGDPGEASSRGPGVRRSGQGVLPTGLQGRGVCSEVPATLRVRSFPRGFWGPDGTTQAATAKPAWVGGSGLRGEVALPGTHLLGSRNALGCPETQRVPVGWSRTGPEMPLACGCRCGGGSAGKQGALLNITLFSIVSSVFINLCH